jgi:hypothetical protein
MQPPKTGKCIRGPERGEGEGLAVSDSLGPCGFAGGERVLGRDRDRTAAVGIEQR